MYGSAVSRQLITFRRPGAAVAAVVDTPAAVTATVAAVAGTVVPAAAAVAAVAVEMIVWSSDDACRFQSP